MTQVLDEPWGRFHLDFPNDERFLSMPEKDEIRGKAYLVLLAMAGRSVIERSDGEISQAVFGDLCKRLWPETPAGLLWKALIDRRVGLIRRTSRGLRLVRQSKWQRTKAEIFSAMEAGRKGASKRWGSDRGAHGVPNRQPHIGDPIAEKEEEREQEREEEKRESKKETKELTLLSDVPLDVAPVDRIFRSWLASRETWAAERGVRVGTMKLDDKRRKRITDALASYPLEDVADAVQGWLFIPHNRGENDRNRPFNDIELLLRDSQRIETFRDATRGHFARLGPTQKPNRLDSWAADLMGSESRGPMPRLGDGRGEG